MTLRLLYRTTGLSITLCAVLLLSFSLTMAESLYYQGYILAGKKFLVSHKLDVTYDAEHF